MCYTPVMKPDSSETTKKLVLFAATVSSFLSPFTISSTNVALPTIARQFHMGAILMTWVPMAYILAGVTLLLPFGKVADIYGRKKVFVYGIALFTLASLVSGLALSSSMFILSMAILGIGGSMVFGTGMAVLLSVYPPSERGKVLGVTIGAVYVGLSVGPFVGGFLTEQLGWRSIFLVNVPLGLAILGLVLWKLKGEWAEAAGERFDLVGSVVYCVAIVAVMYGFQMVSQVSGALILSGGVAGLCLFLYWETRVRYPILDWSLFRHNRVFALSNAATFINYSATYALAYLISLYLQQIKHLSPQGAGLVMVSQPVMQAIFTPYAGKLSDRVEPQKVASYGMGLTVIGLVAFAFLSEKTGLPFVVAVLALHGFGFALFSSPNTNAIMGSVEKRYYGVASNIVSSMRLLGNSFSIGTAMLVFSHYIGEAQITVQNRSAFLVSVRLIFVVFALLCLIGVFASLARGKMRSVVSADMSA
ncbi:MAG TPA: MFS transporter [Syntrophorhabdales bacterium]|nr:MFS transporter [Syntrophorhabdales bacterium]